MEMWGKANARTTLNGLSLHLSEDDCSEVQISYSLICLYQRTDYESAEGWKLNGVSIRYGDRTI